MNTSKAGNLETLLTNQNYVLEMITSGKNLYEILNKIACLIEEASPMWSSFLLLGKDAQTLHHAASPSLPKGYCEVIDGVGIGPNVGSCGTAAYLKEQVIVTDIATDPLWSDFAQLAANYNLAACWSTPIFSKEGNVLGTFAMYYPEPRSPTMWDIELIDKATHLAGIAISKRDDEIELQELHSNLEKKVEQRTAELSNALANLENTQQQLIQSEKMAALGNLTASIAHEINNPTSFTHAAVYMMPSEITEIKSFLKQLAGGDGADKQVLQSFDDKFTKLIELSQTATEGTKRIKTIVDGLRAYSHQGHLNKENSHVSELIKSTIYLLRTQYRDITIKTSFEDDPLINCFPSKLNQVFMNLFINACQAINTKKNQLIHNKIKFEGTLIIKTKKIDGNLIIEVIDNGSGMDDTTQEKLFEPFYTTKNVNSGTGLGMSVSIDVIKSHNGKIKISSELGEGSTISIYLPIE